MKNGFTLIELIVVIIIVAILAAVGITQYGKTVGRGRNAEAKMILGQMRTLAYQYRLENGTITGVTDADLNIGAAPGVPKYPTCRETYWFAYLIASSTDPVIRLDAYRCTSGGKSPQATGETFGSSANVISLSSNLATGTDAWYIGANR